MRVRSNAEIVGNSLYEKWNKTYLEAIRHKKRSRLKEFLEIIEGNKIICRRNQIDMAIYDDGVNIQDIPLTVSPLERYSDTGSWLRVATVHADGTVTLGPQPFRP